MRGRRQLEAVDMSSITARAHSNAAISRSETSDGPRPGTLAGHSLLAGQVHVHDGRGTVALLEIGVGETYAFEIPAGDGLEPEVVVLGRQACLQKDCVALDDDRDRRR